MALQRRRPDDAPQALQTLVGIHTRLARHLGSGVLGVLFDPERGEVPRYRAFEMPRRHDVLLPLRRGFLVALTAHGLLVLVGGQHDANTVLLTSLARRARHFQAVAGLSGGFLCSSVQRKVLGDVLRYVETAATTVVRKRSGKSGLALLGHDHLFAFPEALPYEAHLVVEALHSVLTATYILRIFVVDELRFTVFADEYPAFVIRNPVCI